MKARVRFAGFDLLVVGPVYRYGKEDLLLRQVRVFAGGLDAPAEALAFTADPLIVGRV